MPSIFRPLLFLCLLGVYACKTPIANTSVSSKTKGEAEFQQYLKEKTAQWKGKEAPDFQLADIEGKTFHLSDFKDKIVLLNFWFMDCPPCITEISSLKQLHQNYSNRGVVLVSVALDASDKLAPFCKERQIPYWVLPNGKPLAEQYKVTVYPTTYLIEKGSIQEIFVGSSDWDGTQTYYEIKPHLDTRTKGN